MPIDPFELPNDSQPPKAPEGPKPEPPPESPPAPTTPPRHTSNWDVGALDVGGY